MSLIGSDASDMPRQVDKHLRKADRVFKDIEKKLENSDLPDDVAADILDAVTQSRKYTRSIRALSDTIESSADYDAVRAAFNKIPIKEGELKERLTPIFSRQKPL